MPITLGLDIGTTTMTALALDAHSGHVLARATRPNEANITTAEDRARGRSEWDAGQMLQTALVVLGEVVGQLGERRGDVVGLGLTGQQHGVVLVDEETRPLTPFINWQDRRGEEIVPGTEHTYTQHAVAWLGPDAGRRTGCSLASGYLGTTLFWLRANDQLPDAALACFITDFVGARLTATRPVTDPTMAASSGLLNVQARNWDAAAIQALDLPPAVFPRVREAGDPLGGLTKEAADATGLPAGLPVFVGLGDNQASFVGSVAHCAASILVNVGTGAQVSRYVERAAWEEWEGGEDALGPGRPEVRPFPRGGYLLVHAGLFGGRTYALLDRFFRQVGADLFDQAADIPLYARLNELARSVPAGADGLRCEPFFTGSRAEPARRAVWTGMSDANFTPAHLTRALLEGMARRFHQGFSHLQSVTSAPVEHLVGAGNGLRENPTLAEIVATQFGLPVQMTVHREEAAYGAALVASVGAEVWPDLARAGRIIHYGDAITPLAPGARQP
ncbi:MAG: hypothetical protein KIT87_26130 [Anaerolineae bacterium]|nr:hypothetical protein [Anaerolineae bacterium]